MLKYAANSFVFRLVKGIFSPLGYAVGQTSLTFDSATRVLTSSLRFFSKVDYSMKCPPGSVFCSSEIAPLRRVIVHRPDEGIARISPKDAEELLFDDIVHLPNMQEEHDVFTAVLRAFLGKENVLETQQLLAEALGADEESKQWMINEIIDYEELPSDVKELLQGLSNDELADLLISGYMEKEDYYLFDPIPNFIFTRDIAVVVNDYVIITKAARSARFRENFLARFIFFAHPIFKDTRDQNKIINMNDVNEFPPSRKGDFISIEGGDMMIINKDYLLIGCSERTNSYSIKLLKEALFARKVVKNVVQEYSAGPCLHAPGYDFYPDKCQPHLRLQTHNFGRLELLCGGTPPYGYFNHLCFAG